MSTAIRYSIFAALLAVVTTQSGCLLLSSLMGQKRGMQIDTSLLEAQGYSIPPGGMPMQVKQDLSGKPRVVLEVRTSAEQRHVESIPVPADRGIFIEDLVRQAQLHDRIGAMNISIMRPSGTTAPPIRMELQTDTDGKATSMSKNYALLPGDHIIVVEDQRSSIEKFIESQFK